MPKPLCNRVSGFEAFFSLLQDCCYKLADSGADGFLYCKKKKGKKRKEKEGLKISPGEFGIMKGLFWEGALLRKCRPRAAAGPLVHSQASAELRLGRGIN